MKKIEFSKLILAAVMITYFAGVIFGIVFTAEEKDTLGEILTYIGAPTAAAIGFYSMKAGAENVHKIDREDDADGDGEEEKL